MPGHHKIVLTSKAQFGRLFDSIYSPSVMDVCCILMANFTPHGTLRFLVGPSAFTDANLSFCNTIQVNYYSFKQPFSEWLMAYLA